MHAFRYFCVQQTGREVVATFVEAHLQGEMMAELLQHELSIIMDELEAEEIVLDFQKVSIISTSIVSCLLKTREECARRAIRLKLAGMSDTLFSIFRTLRLEQVFAIFTSVEQAKASKSGSVSYQDVVGRPPTIHPDDAD